MNQKIKKTIQYAALPLAFAAGVFVSRIGLEDRVNDLVSKAYEKEAKKFRIEFDVSADVNQMNDYFSKNEKFIPSNQNKDKSYLDTKAGFEYSHSETKTISSNTIIPGLSLDIDYGAVYNFEVVKDYKHAYERLFIAYYEGDVFNKVGVFINDYNHDGFPDRIYINDNKNNTSVSITRNKDGVLEYEYLNEDGAKVIYEYYTQEYNFFKEKHKIDEKIMNYEPKLEIKKYKLDNK